MSSCFEQGPTLNIQHFDLPSEMTIECATRVYADFDVIINRGHKKLVIDASEIGRVDAAGIQILMAMHAHLGRRDVQSEWLLSRAVSAAFDDIGSDSRLLLGSVGESSRQSYS